MKERHVQAIWYDGKLRPKNLLTRRGEAVNVVSPGEWNTGAGPDFRRAVLEIGRERRRVTGDVEVHLCPSDWDLHGHGSDPEYRNVVAHVTWGCGPAPTSLPPGAVSIWLGRFVTSNPYFSPMQIDLDAYPYAHLASDPSPCEARLAGNPDLAKALLAEAGRRRMRLKARRLAGRLCAKPSCDESSRRQIFYEEVMAALGYKRNEASFRHVAERVPISELPYDGDAAKTALLVAGGFEEWRRGGTRPRNSPGKRLECAAELFTSTPTMRLADASGFSPPECRAMVTAMCGERFIGRGRAAAIIANVVLPFAMAEDRTSECPEWLPPEDVSQPVRLTAFRLFGRDHNPSALYASNGLYIQGLLQIRLDCCLRLHPECSECEVAAVGLGQRLRAGQ